MNGSTIRLDWNHLLGFDRARGDDIGKAPATAAKVGEKNDLRRSLSLGRKLDTKAGHKDAVERSSTTAAACIGINAIERSE